jgi:acyl-homoserine lactone acylase PvdQ
MLCGQTALAKAPAPEPYGAHDAGGFHNILPPGENGLANAAQILSFEATHAYPPHSNDQLGMYANLLYGSKGLTDAQIGNYYKDATFGVKPDQVESTYSPRSDVTIERDSYGVPHIYGATRDGAMFGAGYAVAQDRLFFIDALRAAGRAELSNFAGGANVAMDESVWADSPYTEADLQQQYDQADDIYGHRGSLIQEDVQNFVEGINQYVDEACANPLKMPGEYALIGKLNYPCSHPFQATDVLSIGSLVAGIFGKGGGGELSSALVLETLQKRFGGTQGERVWSDFRSQNDPEAPTTVHHTRFPYEQTPKHPRGVAMPDPGSVQFANVVQSKSAGAGKLAAPDGSGKLPDADLLAPLRQHTDDSNALLVSARESKSGHPIAVFGPQVSYFTPEILMEEDIHAPARKGQPGMDARGASFPGTNLYVQLGHGRNYAWSATSAGQDIVDTYAVKLCNPGGGKPTMSSGGYMFSGQCLPFDVLTRNLAWTPNLGDMTPAGSETLTSYRSKLGIVIARARIHGKPYAYTRLRDTYGHEVDPSALGFSEFDDPKHMQTPAEFMKSASDVALTFNWMYINSKHIAYYNSGQNPLRPKNVDPSLPVMGKPKFLWKGFNPDRPQFKLKNLRRQLTHNHPNVVDQRYITSWNNKQAPGFSAADGQYAYGPQYRSQALDDNIRKKIRGPKKMGLAQLVSAMEDAGTVDDRGPYDLPYVFRVIGNHGTTAEQSALHTLKAWVRSGSHRIDRNKDGHYDSEAAIRIIDAWWPKLVTAEFKPTLGQKGFDAVHSMIAFDDPDRNEHLGSAFDGGWYGYVQKDLRTLLGDHVRGRYSRVYCGHGSLGACRQDLLRSLDGALAHDSDAEIYPEGPCTLLGNISATAQACSDLIHFRALGAVTQPDVPWVNRPTFQQTVKIK